MFALADLFLVGTALDLVGGVLIAKGLLVSLRTLGVRATTFWGGNPTVAVGAVEDRVDAQFGLLALAFGFVLQALGYFVTLLSEPTANASGGRAFTALGLAVAAALAVLFAWSRLRIGMIRRSLVMLACWERTARKSTLTDAPSLPALAGYGRAWIPGPDEESDEEAVARVFGSLDTRSEEQG
jgi:hypothetical protein